MAYTLYAATGENSDSSSDLYTIDPATLTATSVGPIGFALTGLAVDPNSGILYGLTSDTSAAQPHSIITIDPITGAGTFVANIQPITGDNATASVDDICFDSTGQMYGCSDFDGGLVKIDKATGSSTNITAGGSPDFGGGLDVDPNTGTLWFVGNRTHIYTCDTTTGVLAFVSDLPFANPDNSGNRKPGAASFNPDDGLLYYIAWPFTGGTYLYKASAADLAQTPNSNETVLGDIGTVDWGAIAWVAVTLPPPATPAGFSLALDDNPLAENPTWTRIDTLPGVRITDIQIHRGRPTERDKTLPGTVTIRGVDSMGILDPTNTNGPYYGKLDPVKQAAVTLYNPVTADWHWLFRGHVDTYSYTLDVSERFTTFEITLVDMLDILNDAEVIPDQAGNAVPAESAGDCFYTGQHCDDRLLAVLADASTAFMGKTWPASLLVIASGNVFVQGRVYANRTSLLQVVDEAADAEFPGATNRFISKKGEFSFRGRYYRFVPAAYTASSDAERAPGHELVHWQAGDLAAFADDDTVAVCTGLKFERGKANLINAALITPVGITDSQLASNTNFASDATSVADYGPRTSGMSLENLITDNADDGNNALEETASFAAATVHNYKDPVTYVSEMTFRNPPATTSLARRTNVWAILTGVELSDLVTTTSSHPGGGGFKSAMGNDQDGYVEWITYQLKPLQGDEWDVTLTVGLSSRHHFTWMPTSPSSGHYSHGWNPPSP
jgi:hypothetical protein